MTSIIYCILGLVLFFFKSPTTEVYAPYRKSKWMLAAGMWMISINIWIWLATFTGLWTRENAWVASFDTILFYLIGICYTFSFGNLTDYTYISKQRCKITAIKFGATAFIALIAMVETLEEYRQFLLIIALLGIIELCAQHIISFHRTYLQRNELLENYFSSDKKSQVRWLYISHWLFYILLAFGVFSITSGAVFNWLLQFYVVAVNVYITVNFINFDKEYATLRLATTEEMIAVMDKTQSNNLNHKERKKKEEDEEAEREEVTATSRTKKTYKEDFRNILRPRIAAWVKAKAYTHEQFTLEELASRLYTNKTYLSTFIKEEYDMNFSSWVASLRIDEAKRIMLKEPEKRLQEVAFECGFSSLAYFSSVFSKSEGISPSAWQREFSRKTDGEQ
nr:AraC family transcriptional regulator [uncultured Prevotella sp.]